MALDMDVPCHFSAGIDQRFYGDLHQRVATSPDLLLPRPGRSPSLFGCSPSSLGWCLPAAGEGGEGEGGATTVAAGGAEGGEGRSGPSVAPPGCVPDPS